MNRPTIEDLEKVFDDHPSLGASLQDFEHPGSSEFALSPRFPTPTQRPGMTHYPSHHSGFRSPSPSDSEIEESSAGGYSPPAWRRTGNGARSTGFWKRKDSGLGLRSNTRSKESSPEYESADDGGADELLRVASRTRLPTGSISPEKRRSPSPDPYPHGEKDFARTFGSSGGGHPVIKKEDSPVNRPQQLPTPPASFQEEPENTNNFIRFAVRAEVQHRTEPFEAFFAYVKEYVDAATKSWTSLFSSLFVLFISILMVRSLFQPAALQPAPDLVKVAGLAKAFEPLIFYSENGVTQVADLQATGVAVWDLGESVRTANMTSAPIIVKELEDLSDTLKTLSIELTKFFANVDGDVDGILIVMDWARRELSHLTTLPPSHMSTLYANIHNALSVLGILENRATGTPTALGRLATSILGQSAPQRTRQTLQRTFSEFLSVLEESITNELDYSTSLFALFENIDRQFMNLGRTVSRETDVQDREEAEMLASLWTRIIGSSSHSLKKFEKNKELLKNVRTKTMVNKKVLVEHNQKLMQLKYNLETLRRKLVSPLVRSGNSSSLSVEEQVRGLEGTYEYLRGVREEQKGKLMEVLYGAGRRRVSISREEAYEIEGT